MKKILLVITLAVLLLSMAHTASAVVAMTEFDDGCYCVKLAGDYGIPEYQHPSSPEPMMEIPTTYHIEVDAKVCKSGEDVTVTVLNSNPGVTISELNILSLYKEEITLNASGTCAMGHSFEGEMTLIGDGENYYTTNAMGTVDGQVPVIGSFTATIGQCTPEEIPEFPTIALPVIAILGLAFIMQRRKD
ncbi:MAG: PEF-CTERM sorting domain-containing protein [Methanolobus sp.]|nr:PEF-CTERM sorting domain-containing protein [Methanolobus sp.]